MRISLLSNMANKAVIIYFNPFIGFFIQLTGLVYFDYLLAVPLQMMSVFLLLLIGLIIRMVLNRCTGAGVISEDAGNRFCKIRKHVLFLYYLIIVIVLCEYVNILLGRPSIDGLTDVRAVLYSSYFSSFIVYILYYHYLSLCSIEYVRFLVRYIVKSSAWLSIVFSFFWLFIFFGVIEVPNIDAYTNVNSVSYYCLFSVIVIVSGFVDFGGKDNKIYLFFNLIPVILNTTRGAFLVLLIYAFVYFWMLFLTLGRGTKILASLALLPLLLLSVYIIPQLLLGSGVSAIVANISHVSYLDPSDALYVKGLNGMGELDNSSLSSMGRMLANYFAILNFMKSPFIGVGQGLSYGVDVLGAGIHSFYFLLLSTSGLLGIIVFWGVVVVTFRWGPYKKMLFVFPSLVLMFVNAVPYYFALLPFMLSAFEKPFYLND